MSDLLSMDLFAGAGGLSQGLIDAGFRSVFANELDPVYASTYALNHPEVEVRPGDIRGIDAARVRAELGLERGQLDLLAGGPPCQGFSINAPERREDDSRNHLFREFLRFTAEFQPTSVLIENVPGLVNFGRGETLSAILSSLEGLGYRADVRILYAPHFGVPQTRFRTIVLASRLAIDPLALFPEREFEAPMRVNFTSRWRGRHLVDVSDEAGRGFTTVRDAIGDLPQVAMGQLGDPVKQYATEPQNWFQKELRDGSDGVTHHEGGRLAAVNLERIGHIPPGGNWTDIPFDLLPKGMKRARRSDHTKRYGRAHPDELSCTILTKCDPHWGAYFHYEQDRTFTVREAARIQTFPDWYLFEGKRVAQYEQVGNAVPPMMARAIGRSIAEQIAPAAREAVAS